MPLLGRMNRYVGFMTLGDYKRKGMMCIENSMSSLVFFADCSQYPTVYINDGNCTCRVCQTCRIPFKHIVFTHLQVPEFTDMLYSSSYS